MKRIVITLYDHTDEQEAQDIYDDLLRIGIQPEHVKVEGITVNIKCERCGLTWDTISPCALCNATQAQAHA